MVTDRKKDSGQTPIRQGPQDVTPEPNKINASTPYDFKGKNLTPYGGLLPVITMLEKLGFQSLAEQTITSERIPRAMDLYRFVLGIVLGLYVGFPRLNQLRFNRARSDPDGHPAGGQAAGAIHLLEVHQCAASECRSTDFGAYANQWLGILFVICPVESFL
jgi:hypothetical protein